MEAPVMLRSSAVSMAMPLAPALGVMRRRSLRLGVERSMAGRVAAVPQQRRRGVMRMCTGEVRLAGELGKIVSEIDGESERVPFKMPQFPLLDLYDFICRYCHLIRIYSI
jgi:hypothetical protein